MTSSTCTIKFFLKLDLKEHPKKGFPVYCRITCQRKKARFATGEYCIESNWESKVGTPLKSPRLRERLIDIEKNLLDIKRHLEFSKKNISAKLIRDRYLGKLNDGNAISLIDYLAEYIRKISLRKEEYTKGTIRHYKTTKKHLLNFLRSRGEENITIQDFSREHVEALDDFFISTPTAQYNRPMGRNTANKYHTKIKTVLLDAVRKKIIPENPYLTFPLKNKLVERSYLSKEDLVKLESHNLGGNEALQKARDIFLWSCYTGLRFSDTQDLKRDDIIIDKEGNFWLDMEQGKTKTEINIPLVKKAISLYHKYESLREVTGRVLPKLVNQKVNTYLKVIADIVGIKQKLTHHIARHTFATTVL